jgi:hypothetical protein
MKYGIVVYVIAIVFTGILIDTVKDNLQHSFPVPWSDPTASPNEVSLRDGSIVEDLKGIGYIVDERKYRQEQVKGHPNDKDKHQNDKYVLKTMTTETLVFSSASSWSPLWSVVCLSDIVNHTLLMLSKQSGVPKHESVPAVSAIVNLLQFVALKFKHHLSVLQGTDTNSISMNSSIALLAMFVSVGNNTVAGLCDLAFDEHGTNCIKLIQSTLTSAEPTVDAAHVAGIFSYSMQLLQKVIKKLLKDHGGEEGSNIDLELLVCNVEYVTSLLNFNKVS